MVAQVGIKKNKLLIKSVLDPDNWNDRFIDWADQDTLLMLVLEYVAMEFVQILLPQP